MIPAKAFRERRQFAGCAVWFPDYAAIVQNPNDDAVQRATECFDAVTGFPVGGFAQRLNNLDHCLPRQDTGDVMGDGGHDLATADGRQVGEKGGHDLPRNVGESVTIEEKERGAAMTLPQELYGFGEREDLLPPFVPLAAARFLSLSINAVLRASSCARSSVVADDRLPTPVFDKSGSGL